MSTMVITKQLSPELQEQIQQIIPDWRMIVSSEPPDYEPYLDQADIIAGFIRKELLLDLLTRDTPLRWIHAWSAGVNDLPMEKISRRGIILTNSSGVHANPISETILAMMLTLSRSIQIHIRNQTQWYWQSDVQVAEMHGKTLGILGVGAIGAETARIARAFRMKILGMRRSGEPLPDVDVMYDTSGLSDLLKASDYVVNILPSTAETRHLMSTEQFACMKPGAFYISVGRGETTDTEALLSALKNGKIAGAGLDVFEQEPLPEDHELWSLPQVIITPHNAGINNRYDERVLDILLPNLRDFAAGRQPALNVVDPVLFY